MSYNPTKSKVKRSSTLYTVIAIHVFLARKCGVNVTINRFTEILTFPKL